MNYDKELKTMKIRHEQELKDLEEEYKKEITTINYKVNYEIADLAIFLHENICIFNHMDGCGWYYNENKWDE